MSYPGRLEKLIEQFNKLPGVGRRSAERMAFWVLGAARGEVEEFAAAMLDLKEHMRYCRRCRNLSDHETCRICNDPGRDTKTICVVEDHRHLLAIERSGSYKGLYHVLPGAMEPTEGRGPDDLDLDELARRVEEEGIAEIVIATDPDPEGEMTATHIANVLRRPGLKISRIGLGIPVGGSVEYADLSTLSVALAARRELQP